MKFRHWLLAGISLVILVGAMGFALRDRIPAGIKNTWSGRQTVEQAIARYGTRAEQRLREDFRHAGIAYPPTEVALLALKQSRRMEVWARGDADWRWVRDYPIQALSGGPGPKLREGDRQVPEGIYRIIGLNPNSAYHLSLKLDYPNTRDQLHARREGRDRPGSNIFIHGKASSIGCLAMGDPVIEELFTLTYRVGRKNLQVLIAPRDPRIAPLVAPEDAPNGWRELYRELEQAFMPFSQRPNETGRV